LSQHQSTEKSHSATPQTPPDNYTMSIDFPKEEERILARWKEIDAFLRQVELVSSEYVPRNPVDAAFDAGGGTALSERADISWSKSIYVFTCDNFASYWTNIHPRILRTCTLQPPDTLTRALTDLDL
jgi:hypothetical protein